MCGRYVIPDEESVARWCPVPLERGYRWLQALFNVAPTTAVPILTSRSDGGWESRAARWGLIPSWWQRPMPPSYSFNARREDIDVKPMWREGFRATRCLIPAQGWYEWQLTERPGRAARQPFYISSAESELLAFAGIYATWRQPHGAPVTSCAIITTAAVREIAAIHSRMPVLVRADLLESWLAPNTSPQELLHLLSQPARHLVSHPVSARVNSIRNDGPELIQKVSVATTDQFNFE